MQKFIKTIKKSISTFLNPVPETEAEYVDKVVNLLRRDFNTATQNKILLSVANKLSDLREKDMRNLEKEYAYLQENTNTLKSKMATI